MLVVLPLFAAIVLLALLAEAVVGFGSTVLTVTLGAHLLPLDVLLPIFVPLNLVLSLYLVTRYRRTIDWRLLGGRVLPVAGLGTGAGLLLFRLQSSRALLLVFAVFVVLLAAVELIRALRGPRRSTQPLRPLPGVALLSAGGVIHGLFGSGGPMIVYFASRELRGKAAFRSTLSALWIVLNAALVVNYAALGLFTAETTRMSLLLLPVVALGTGLGDRLHGRLPERPFQLMTYGLLLFAGAALVVRQA